MITEFHIENFKSYECATLPVAPLTLLVGTNASGKSNAIEAIQFLHALGRGKRLDELVREIQDDEVAIRGRSVDLARFNEDRFYLGCTIAAPGLSHPQARQWTEYGLRVVAESRGRGSLEIVHEEVTAPDVAVPLFRVEQPAKKPSTDLTVSYNNFARGGIKPRISASSQRSLLTQLDTPTRYTTQTAQTVIPMVVDHFRESLASVLFLDPNPRSMRGYSFIDEEQLKGDGSNVSSILYRLRESGETAEVLNFIRSLPEQDIVGFEFVMTERNEVMVRLRESFGARHRLVDAPVLSDGTLRVLAIAAAVLSAPEGTLVVIEEIDNGVHPSRAELLISHIQSVAKRRQLNVLISSHNPALADALPVDALRDVVVAYRDPDTGASRLRKLSDHPDFPRLVAMGPLGRAMASGVLEKEFKSLTSYEMRRSQAKAWFDHFVDGVGT